MYDEVSSFAQKSEHYDCNDSYTASIPSHALVSTVRAGPYLSSAYNVCHSLGYFITTMPSIHRSVYEYMCVAELMKFGVCHLYSQQGGVLRSCTKIEHI